MLARPVHALPNVASLKSGTGISACIITLNEADRIVACIQSLSFCDEVIVVDSGSSDNTCELARSLGARVEVRPFDGYRSQKNHAVQLARNDWVLCLDADERVSEALRLAIYQEQQRNFAGHSGYRFPRLTRYFGAWLRHGNAYPDRVLRLFDRRRGGWHGEREIHESVTIDGSVGSLHGDLLHEAYRSLSDQVNRRESYARKMAEHAYANGQRAGISRMVLSPLWRFLRGYVFRLGFLDGWRGLIYAYVSANYVRQKSINLWLLERGHPI